jgi:hypothetical protein
MLLVREAEESCARVTEVATRIQAGESAHDRFIFYFAGFTRLRCFHIFGSSTLSLIMNLFCTVLYDTCLVPFLNLFCISSLPILHLQSWLYLTELAAYLGAQPGYIPDESSIPANLLIGGVNDKDKNSSRNITNGGLKVLLLLCGGR